MALRLFIGETDSGKTQQVYSEMITMSEAGAGKKHILLIVPEQATLEAQKTLVAEHPRHCISGVEVLSFQRLAYRVGDTLGIAGKTLLTDVGKHMLIRQLIEGSKDEFPFLSRYIHKKGYINELASLLTEFSRYTLDLEDFERVYTTMDQSVLKIKLHDLKTLYSHYNKTLEERYLSGESVMERLVMQCHESGLLKNAHIYLDGFYGYTPIQYRLIRKLVEIAKDVTVTISIPPSLCKGGLLDESHLFYESRLTYEKIKGIMLEDPRATVEEIVMTANETVIAKAFLRDNFYQYPYQVYQRKVTGVSINRCTSYRQEVAYLRDSILRLVRYEGYHFKDITVLAGATGSYKQLLSEVFPSAGISYYVDDKQPVVTNEGVGFVLALVKLYSKNFDYTSVFDYLKSDFIESDHAVLDHMENYVIRYGVRGLSQWQKPWVYKVPDVHKKADDPLAVELLGRVNALRELWIDPIITYRVKGKATVKTYIKALYQLLIHHKFEERLQAKADNYLKEEAFEQSRAYSQIYRIIMDLLDQLSEMMDHNLVDYNQFLELLEAGFETIELGLVPASVDQVIVGDLTRSRIGKRKACFVVGINEGVIPSLNESTGLLTDDERTALEGLGMPLAPTAKVGLFREQFYSYMAMLRFSHQLYLSYTTTDESGKASRASHILTMIHKILPEIPSYDIGEIYKKKYYGSTPAVTYEHYLSLIRSGNPADPAIGKWLLSHAPWAGKLKKALLARSEQLLPKQLSSESNHELYGIKLNNSVSRLEQFSGCPFSHFMTYGLNTRERKAFEITMPHLGMIFHRVIELFSKRLKQRDMDWSEVTDVLRLQWIDDLLSEVLEEETYTVFFDNQRNRHRITRLKKMIDRALWTISWQIVQGDFRPLDAEWRFDGNEHALESINLSLEDQRKMSLRGTIDRVDHHLIAGMDYVTVVDYKSSAHDFDVNQLYAGLQLQLIVYLNAACEIKEATYGQVQPAGVFYFKVDDPFVSGRNALTQEACNNEILGKMRLNGLVVDDHKVIEALDRSFAKKSKVIPISRKTDGTLAKASKIISDEDFDVLRQFTTMKVKALGNEIMQGHIEAKPYKDKKGTACDYCAYKSVCQFDPKLPGYDFREVIEEDQEQVLMRILQEVTDQTVV